MSLTKLAKWFASDDPEPEGAHLQAPSARKPGEVPAAVYRAEAAVAREAYRASRRGQR